LLGYDQVFIVAEMTVPCIRNTQRLVEAVAEKVGRTVDPKVIINRAEATKKNATIRPSDLEELLGDKIAGTVTNNYQLVRTALDKGILIEEVQKNANVLQDLQAIVCPPVGRSAKARSPRKLIRNLFARRQTAQAA
jgi:pilus assembly protein CpaE